MARAAVWLVAVLSCLAVCQADLTLQELLNDSRFTAYVSQILTTTCTGSLPALSTAVADCQNLVNIIVDVDAGNDSPDTSCSATCEAALTAERASVDMDKKLEDTASEKGAEGVANLVDTEGESFSEANVGRAFRAFADTLASSGDAAKMSKHPGFQVLVDMVLSGMSRFPTSTLVQIIDYCGRLGFSEDMLLDEIARHLMDKIPDMPATDLVALTRGYAAVSHSPSILIFQAIGDRLREEGSDLDPKLKEEANAAFEKLGYEGLKPF